ncbi:hypothetical protein [Conexibacter sp. CPCC 206217]|uniref:hypothetical protein n=1 Tax=Conexibacter sp. CPCC 206217 TaxID=3064574 RepID=UPI002722B125|nr:hypothetical protein [Conexibacter sp. CPCC 206217]MDO8209667.1 hypothetical protein [Conexibacter sp. CPCC 206217]
MTISRSQREALRQQVVIELDGLGEIHRAIEDGHAIVARRLREHYEELLRLLDDLGWDLNDVRSAFAVTMDPPAATRVLVRLHDRATRLVADYLGGSGRVVMRSAACDAVLTMSASVEVLAQMVGDEPAECRCGGAGERS